MCFDKLNTSADPFCQVVLGRVKSYFMTLDPKKSSGADKISCLQTSWLSPFLK